MVNPIAGDIGNTLIGGALNWLSAKNETRHQERLQREFAQNAIQWKVADAQKAGIHPLYALGAPTMNYAPQSIGGMDAAGGMGQDISRAINAGMPREGQLSAFDAAVQELTLKKFGLENELLSAQIARMNQETLGKPALPAVTLPSGAGRIVPGQSSKAQVVQDEYGDIVENGYGVWRLLNDVFANMVGPGKGVPSKGPKSQGGYGYAKTGRR